PASRERDEHGGTDQKGKDGGKLLLGSHGLLQRTLGVVAPLVSHYLLGQRRERGESGETMRREPPHRGDRSTSSVLNDGCPDQDDAPRCPTHFPTHFPTQLTGSTPPPVAYSARGCPGATRGTGSAPAVYSGPHCQDSATGDVKRRTPVAR